MEIPKHIPVQAHQYQGRLKAVGKAIKPGESEVAENPRARSAVMRVARRQQESGS